MRWLHWNAGSSHLQRRRLEMLPRQTSTPGDGWLEASTHNVRFGSEADMCSARADVRFTPNSDIKCDTVECPLWPEANTASSRCDRKPALAALFTNASTRPE